MRAQATYAKKTLFVRPGKTGSACPRKKALSRGSGRWLPNILAGSARASQSGRRLPLRSHPMTVFLVTFPPILGETTLAVNPDNALGYPGEYLPGNRSGFGGEFTGQNLLVTLLAKKDGLVPSLNMFKMADVYHDLVHRHPA
jgi:hypothetical protein